MGQKHTANFDRDLSNLLPELRWREWIQRIEAVLFASSTPVGRDELVRVVGQGVSIDLLIADLGADLATRPYEVAQVGAGWVLRTRPAYGPVIRAAADIRDQSLDLREGDMAVLAAIAYHLPVTRDGLKQIFGREVSRDLIGRLSARGLIAPGPRAPQRGAPYSFVTTDAFLAAFDLSTLADLPEVEHLSDAGFVVGGSEGVSQRD